MLPLNLSCQTSARYQIQPKFKIYYESSLAHYEKKKQKKQPVTESLYQILHHPAKMEKLPLGNFLMHKSNF